MTRRIKPDFIPCDIRTGNGKSSHSPIDCNPKSI